MTGIQRVLIVDDLHHARKYLRTILEATGIACAEAANGEEALEFAEPDVDLVFTDLRMPVVDGFELIERIGMGAMGASPPLVVVVSAGLGEARLRKRVEALDCAGVIEKPYVPMQINRLIWSLEFDMRQRR